MAKENFCIFKQHKSEQFAAAKSFVSKHTSKTYLYKPNIRVRRVLRITKN